MEVDSVDPGRDDPMLICANRTKPANSNKYAKRVRAKQAKKLELAENAEFVLSPKNATTYRHWQPGAIILHRTVPTSATHPKNCAENSAFPTWLRLRS